MVAAMQQIADWLKELGMAEYTERFVENHIDESVIRELTDQDLNDLGVVSLRPRPKMLSAIRYLGNASVAATAPSAPVEIESAKQDDAERQRAICMHRRSEAEPR